MERNQIETVVIEELQNIAPEMEADLLDWDEDLREELDIDSMDFMILTVALGKRLGVQIPDRDHHLITSFNKLVDYLQRSLS